MIGRRGRLGLSALLSTHVGSPANWLRDGGHGPRLRLCCHLGHLRHDHWANGPAR
jgi:hypothetical protein